MSSLTRNRLMNSCKTLVLAASLSVATLAGGCSGFDGVELQGGVFDAMGLSGSGQKRLADTKVEARPGLVLPPSHDKLPEPVTGSLAAAPSGEAWPIDPENRRAQSKAEREKRHAAFCERALQDARIRGESGVVMGPNGNCQPGMFGSLTGLIQGKQE